MPAVKSVGAYIPYYRLNREEIGRAWGGFPQTGEKAVANFDEDSITLSVEAARDCLKGIDNKKIDGLYFASSTAPFQEKQCASIIAAALDFKKDVFTVDFTNTLRAGTNALRAAIDAVKAGSAQSLLVVAADCRLGTPGSSFEQDIRCPSEGGTEQGEDLASEAAADRGAGQGHGREEDRRTREFRAHCKGSRGRPQDIRDESQKLH